MLRKLKRPLLLLTAIAVMVMSCNLTGGSSVDEAAAAQTVEAELTRIAAADVTPPTEEAASPEAPTATLEPPTATPVEPTPTAGVEGCTDRATFVTDVTVPDGTDFEPGDGFVKTWRLRNDGTCTWTSSYALVFDHGDAMGAPASVSLPGIVPPGSNVDLSVSLTAPGAEGEYQGFYKLRNNSNVLFGIGAGGNTAFWVRIEVMNAPPPPSATPTQLILIPITLIPFFWHSNGTDEILAEGGCFDLDQGQSVGCGSGNADFKYDYVLSGFPPSSKQNYVPRNGTEARFISEESPSKADCQGLSMSGSAFDLDPGDEYCFVTTGGRYGYIHVDSAGFGSLQFDWVTYN